MNTTSEPCPQCEACRAELAELRARRDKMLEQAVQQSVRIDELVYALNNFHKCWLNQPDHDCQSLVSADHWAELTLGNK
jgi:hypothetical protein